MSDSRGDFAGARHAVPVITHPTGVQYQGIGLIGMAARADAA